jgi:EpsI family protein
MNRSRFIIAAAMLALAVVVQLQIDRAYALAATRSAASRLEFREFPKSVGRWRGEFSVLTDNESRLLAVDDYLRAAFTSDYQPGAISVYAGYYRNPDRATQHPPTVCYPGSGWLKTHEARVALDAGNAGKIAVQETVFESGQKKTLVVYWYSLAGYTGADASWQKAVRLARLLSGKGVTGMMKVQVAVTVDTTRQEAEERLEAFLADFLPVLEQFSPRDREEGK